MIAHPQKVAYVVRDIERALGVVPNANYRVISNRTPYAETVQAEHRDFVTLVDGMKDTAGLLQDPATKQALLAAEVDSIIVFKPTARIEEIAAENGWKILNPKAELAERIENKITQVGWLDDLALRYLPQHTVTTGKEMRWNGSPFVAQWAHGHTGESTIVVRTEAEMRDLSARFPDRDVRVSAYVRGPSFTVNSVVTGEKTLMGNINYQITGLAPFTDNAFTTVGNDWSLAHTLLSDSEVVSIETMIGAIGLRLSESGWRGLFGVDFMRDDELNQLFLIEINARQPAGAVFESHLQSANRRAGLPGSTVLEAHLQALSGTAGIQPLIQINDGAQVIQRVTKSVTTVDPAAASALSNAGYRVISYPNTAHNADLLRIQSDKGIMENHNKLNARGTQIAEVLGAK